MATALMKVPELMRIFSVSYWTVLRWAREGQFGAFKQGKSWYFPEQEVKRATERGD